MSIDPATFSVSLFLSFFEYLISNTSSKLYKYHGFSRFICRLCAVSDSNEFRTLFKNTYPKELELKVEHQGNHV